MNILFCVFALSCIFTLKGLENRALSFHPLKQSKYSINMAEMMDEVYPKHGDNLIFKEIKPQI